MRSLAPSPAPLPGDLQDLQNLARGYMPEDFIETAEDFDRLCRETEA